MRSSQPPPQGYGRRLLRNSALNVAGYGLPLIAAVFTIPLLLRGLGTDRFGFLALGWALLGYASLLDLGLARALVKFAAEENVTDSPVTTWPTIRAGLLMMASLGGLIGVLLALISPGLVGGLIKVPAELGEEAVHALYLLALSIPFVTHASGLRAILEARHEFGLVNAVRIPLGVLTFAAPLAVLPYSASLESVIGVLFALRVAAWAVHRKLAAGVCPELRGASGLRHARIGALLGMGAWVTVSNLLGPVFLYADRFLIAGIASVAAVAYYVTPWEVVTKLLVYPGALAGVLFPIFATHFSRDATRAARFYDAGVRYAFLGLFPFVLLFVAFAGEGMALWLGAEFAAESTRVAQVLALGVLANGVAQVPFALLQACGRAGLAARAHLIQLPPFLLAMYLGIRHFGVEGAAVVWSARVAIDLAVMLAMAQRCLGRRRSAATIEGIGVMAAVFALAVAFGFDSLWGKAAYLALILGLFVLFTWMAVMKPEEKAILREFIVNARQTGT